MTSFCVHFSRNISSTFFKAECTGMFYFVSYSETNIFWLFDLFFSHPPYLSYNCEPTLPQTLES